MAVTINGTTGIVTPDIGVDGSTLVIDAANDRIGIGTTSPATTLDVAGTGQFKNNGSALKIESDPGNNFTQVQFKNDGGSFFVGRENNSGNWFATGSNYASVLRSDGAYPLIFSVNGANRLRITSAGLVGIGTDNPAEILHLNGATTSSLLRFTSGTYGTASTDGSHIGINFGGLEVWHKENNYLRFATNNTERLRITSAGLVGIGTDTPTAKLEVATSVDGEATLATFKNTSGGGTNETVDIKLGLENTVASNVILRAGKEANHSSSSATDNFFSIHTTSDNTSAERLRITSGGNVGIGEDAPVSKLHLANSGSGNVSMTITNDTTGHTTGNGVEIGMGGDEQAQIWNYENTYFRIATNSTERLRITNTGRLVIGHTSEVTGAYDNSAQIKQVQIINGANDGNQGLGIYSYSSSGWAPRIELAASRSSSKGGHTVVTDGQSCGLMAFNGSDGTDFSTVAMIGANVSGTPADNAIPGSLSFYTSPGVGLVERLHITNEGTVNINTSADGSIGGFGQPQLYLKTSGNDWTSGLHLEENSGDSVGVINHSSDGFEISQSYRTSGSGSYKPIIFRTSSYERLRITSDGEIVINGDNNARARLDVRQAGNSLSAFNITFPDNSFYRNLGTVGPNDTVGNNASNGGQYLHIRLKTVWNDSSMSMFRLTAYWPYSAYGHSYTGMYRYGAAAYRANPYGQFITNEGNKALINNIYNTTADPGYLVIVCDWNNSYTGVMVEHLGAGSSYGSNMQHDLQIIDSKRSTGTSAQW